jgi:hypothetical protein
MTINIQGGLYGSLAYTDTKGVSALAPSLETCNGDPPGTGFNNRRSTAKNGAAKKSTGTFREVTAPGAPAKYGSFNPVIDLLAKIFEITNQILVGGPVKTPPQVSDAAPEVPVDAKPTQAEIAYGHEHTTPLYEGTATIISGSFYVTSKHRSKVEDTGLFEFTLATSTEDNAVAVSHPVKRWPVVRPLAAKLRFTREEHDSY